MKFRALLLAAALAVTTTSARAEFSQDLGEFLFGKITPQNEYVEPTAVTKLRRGARRLVGLDAPSDVQQLVTAVAQQEGVPVRIAHAVIRVESNYNCRARNRSGATGIGQVKPATARGVGVHGNLLDCRTGLTASMRYLRQALAKGGHGCSGISLYESGTGARPHCSAYGRRVMRAAGL